MKRQQTEKTYVLARELGRSRASLGFCTGGGQNQSPIWNWVRSRNALFLQGEQEELSTHEHHSHVIDA
jgi:hypothetical protein